MKKIHKLAVVKKSKIGDLTEVREFCSIRNSEIGMTCIISERVSIKKSFISHNVEINAGTYIENALIDIKTQIAPNCSIVGVTHLFNEDGTNHEDVFERIIIGENVWIGASCVILPGALIGKNSIIAAGSVVKGTISENILYIGNPSRNIMTPLKEWIKQKNKS